MQHPTARDKWKIQEEIFSRVGINITLLIKPIHTIHMPDYLTQELDKNNTLLQIWGNSMDKFVK